MGNSIDDFCKCQNNDIGTQMKLDRSEKIEKDLTTRTNSNSYSKLKSKNNIQNKDLIKCNSINSTLNYEKYNYYRKIQNLLDKKNNKNENKNEIINPGGISFSLPCEAVLNRGIKNELKRIKIEIQNKKLLNLYENPVDTISTYKEKNE